MTYSEQKLRLTILIHRELERAHNDHKIIATDGTESDLEDSQDKIALLEEIEMIVTA